MTTTKLVRSVCFTVVIVLFSLISTGQLRADFSANPLSGCSPVIVQFRDLSTGNPTNWRWDLGNGTISFLRNPSATYFNPGQYHVKLIIQNATGRDSIVRQQYITVYDNPVVQFTSNVRSGCFPLNIQFTDQSTTNLGNVVQWQWDFGDGQFSTLRNPNHVYTSAGNYNVSLRVLTSNGCSKTITMLQYIHIFPGVDASFTNTNPTRCLPPVLINFTNTTTSTAPLTYLWSFGDGNTSNQENPSYVYNNTGSFTIQLIATNSFGCKDTVTRVNGINIGAINTNFNNTMPACENRELSFTNTSSPVPTSSVWKFSDGTTANTINTVKSFPSAGVYQVKLINTYGNCRDSITRTITVFPRSTTDFNATTVTSCRIPATFIFNNTSTGAVSYQWIFGDGGTSTAMNPSHTYDSAGVYTVTLISTNPSGCTDTLKKIDYISITLPEATILDLAQEGCAPFSWTFQSLVNSIEPVTQYLWDFGNGNTSNVSNPTHVFDSGTYTIKLIVTTASGCTDTVIAINGIRAGIRPTPIFFADPRDACARTPINFADSSLGMPDRWLWDFGDGSSATTQFPSHHYVDTGWLTIKLYVWNNGCQDSLIVPDYLHINPPIANFLTTFECADPLVRTFTDRSIGADSWSWSFGDGNSSIQQSPVHTYASSGTYVVQLAVFNSVTGCSDTMTKTLRVIDENADFLANTTNICRRSNVTFNSTANSQNILNYAWSFGDGSTDSINPVTHTYINSGVYDVTLIVTSTDGCKDTLTRQQYIHVSGPIAAFTAPTAVNCRVTNITFTDSSSTDGTHPITQWIWNFGEGSPQTFTAPPFTHTYLNSGSYSVFLTVIDSQGCQDTVRNVSAISISNPVTIFKSTDTATCANSPVRFTSTSTGTQLTYLWSFGDGGTSTLRNPTYNYVADGMYTVKLSVRDRNGCTDSLTKINYIHVASPVAIFDVSDTLGTCPPLVVNFTNRSINYTSFEWDFGDGTGSTLANPFHFYSEPGTFIAKLTVRKLSCTSVYTKTIVVKGPQGSFTYNNLIGCRPLTTNFIGTSIGSISFIWDFNDGTTTPTRDSIISHNYTIPGNYLPKMILIDTSGCVIPIVGRDTIVVKGVETNFSFNKNTLCNPGNVNFTDSTTSTDPVIRYQWLFGDNTNSSAQNPIHTYSVNGLYYPTLTVTSAAGCVDSMRSTVPIKVLNTPRATIIQSSNGCVPLNATFNANLNNPDTSTIAWLWNFGNGQQSTLQNPPAGIYTNGGIYNISLFVASSNGCADTLRTTLTAFSLPVVNVGRDTALCRGTGISLTATGAATYTWSPATGLSCSNCASPVANPDSVKTYFVTGTSAQGCINRDTIKVDVHQRFSMTASSRDSMCAGSSRPLLATGAFSYSWSPTTGLNNPNIPNPIASPSATTVYTVTGTDLYRCFTQTAQIPVKVFPIPTVEAGDDVTINAGQMIDLVPIISADVSRVIWTPSGGTFRNNYPAITVKPRETTRYTVQVANNGGCTASDFVTVNVICNNANVFIPNTFSPNNDGMNDVFYPRGSGLFRIKSMKIFNRWGEIVYERNDVTPNDVRAGWDGTYKGKSAPTDVYVYIMEIMCENNTSLPFKGNVTLIK